MVFSFLMFLFKQPSVLACALCTSICLPHDVQHDCTHYPLFYDPLYFPQYNCAVFKSEQSVCQWLSTGLDTLFSECRSCPRLGTCAADIQISVHFVCSASFVIKCYGMESCVPVCDVESSTFSFCRLHCHVLLMDLRDKVSPPSDSDDCWVNDGLPVLKDVLFWMIQPEECFFSSLSSLSLPVLRDVARLLHHPQFHHKTDYIHFILTDFFSERRHFCSLFSTVNCGVFVSQYFHF